MLNLKYTIQEQNYLMADNGSFKIEIFSKGQQSDLGEDYTWCVLIYKIGNGGPQQLIYTDHDLFTVQTAVDAAVIEYMKFSRDAN
jgi:hypothetical protein